MKKRISLREVALLTVPVLVIGAGGWWLSKRPVGVEGEGTAGLQFQLLPPTTLQSFSGLDGTFAITQPEEIGRRYGVSVGAPHLELKLADGGKVTAIREGQKGFRIAGANVRVPGGVWFPFAMPQLPPGDLYFIYDHKGLVRGKWKIDRAQIRKPNLAVMPRLPLVVLRSVTIDSVSSTLKPGTTVPLDHTVNGEAIFELQGATMGRDTSFDIDMEGREIGTKKTTTYGIGGGRDSNFGTPETPLTRVYHWQMQTPPTKGLIQVKGRVSVGERWPLGFESAPFRIGEIKDGQKLKLKFKSFAVALPG